MQRKSFYDLNMNLFIISETIKANQSHPSKGNVLEWGFNRYTPIKICAENILKNILKNFINLKV